MQYPFHDFIIAAWTAGALVWLGGWLISKRTVRSQSLNSRVGHIVLVGIAFYLLFTTRLSFGFLARRFVPSSEAVASIGLALTVAGVALAIWARLYLGRNWSATVTIKEDHKLIRSGPYLFVRHPIYSGFALAALGTALALGEVRGLLAVAFALLGFRMKARLEEVFMTEQFGSEYTQYKKEVKGLIPFIW